MSARLRPVARRTIPFVLCVRHPAIRHLAAVFASFIRPFKFDRRYTKTKYRRRFNNLFLCTILWNIVHRQTVSRRIKLIITYRGTEYLEYIPGKYLVGRYFQPVNKI